MINAPEHGVSQKKLLIILALCALVFVVLFGVGWRQYSLTASALKGTQAELASTTAMAQIKIIELEGFLAQATHENAELERELEEEREKVGDFENEIKDITKTVDTLEKLSKTDPELLQKYSKIYFLNEHYVPSRLSTIDEAFLWKKTEEEKIHSQVRPHLEDLLEEALEDGIALRVVSAYRSFDEQISIKAGYKVVYGAGTANQFSADQGYSEHQLGTAVDFTDASTTPFVNFEKTAAYEWLLDNAHRYGFVLSYPPGNAYYQFEPWHWRFVGEDLARDLHKKKMFFYDMDQRDINKYLITIFD